MGVWRTALGQAVTSLNMHLSNLVVDIIYLYINIIHMRYGIWTD
jgi:hypothetical protein